MLEQREDYRPAEEEHESLSPPGELLLTVTTYHFDQIENSFISLQHFDKPIPDQQDPQPRGTKSGSGWVEAVSSEGDKIVSL